jgi:hypothetical protein
MSRKQDPIVGVAEFFETASLESAQSALALAKAIVRKRMMPAAAPIKRRRKAKTTKPTAIPRPDAAAIALSATAPATAAATPTTAATRPTRRRGTKVTAPASASAPAAPDLALPGLGPSTVGD